MTYVSPYTIAEVIAFGKDRKARFSFDGYRPDIKGKVYFAKGVPHARTSPATSGYRPAHQVREDIATSGEHIYYENDAVFPGETAMAYIKFLSPEYYPHCLWPGKELEIKEGSRVVGTVTVIEIYNELLRSSTRLG